MKSLIFFEIDWWIVNWIPLAKYLGGRYVLDLDNVDFWLSYIHYLDHLKISGLVKHPQFFNKQSEYDFVNFERGLRKLQTLLKEKEINSKNCNILTSRHPFDTTFAYEIGIRLNLEVDYVEIKKFYRETEEILKTSTNQFLILIGTSHFLERVLQKITLGMTVVNLEKNFVKAFVESVLSHNSLTVEHCCPLVIDFEDSVVIPYRREFLV